MLEIIDKYIFYIDAILQLIPCSGRIKDVSSTLAHQSLKLYLIFLF